MTIAEFEKATEGQTLIYVRVNLNGKQGITVLAQVEEVINRAKLMKAQTIEVEDTFVGLVVGKVY
jgi:hypothetical protein